MLCEEKTRVKLLEVFEDDRAVYLVSEYCPGGSLYDCLAALRKCPEEVAKRWTLQMVRAIGFLQGCGVVHRNLRLESWQLTSQGCFPPLKLYGLSHSTRWHKKEGRLNAACGLLEYTSPGDCMVGMVVMSNTDVLLGRYTDACDMWSLGVIVYQLLCGRPPFVGTQQEKVRQILSGDVNFVHLEKAGASEEAKSFVAQLLTISPHSRLTPQQALEHRVFGLALAQAEHCRKDSKSAKAEGADPPHLFFCATLSSVVGSLFAGLAHSSVGRLTVEDLKRALQREQPEPLGNEEGAVCKHLEAAECFFTRRATPLAPLLTRLVVPNGSQRQVEDIFDALDINKDGEITFTVFAAAMIGVLVEAEDSLLQKAFAKLDVDGDGRLSLDDCRWAFGGTLFGQSLSTALEQEENEDGPLDYVHFSTLVRHKGKPVHRRAYKARERGIILATAQWRPVKTRGRGSTEPVVAALVLQVLVVLLHSRPCVLPRNRNKP
ncbi:CAM kinase, CDPK family, putative [Eimeria praecox]|uniref:CAM kinase, CDPK family, putative n=1 Tax=Eimeria praecox TaxID=51316 RepID=U6G3Z9_9EIME|nr:CAM kinase, CDPK family, putative [Eimeria praecox]